MKAEKLRRPLVILLAGLALWSSGCSEIVTDQALRSLSSFVTGVINSAVNEMISE
jgi:hypothetical protein